MLVGRKIGQAWKPLRYTTRLYRSYRTGTKESKHREAGESVSNYILSISYSLPTLGSLAVHGFGLFLAVQIGVAEPFLI